jgi:hypothetical protein
MERLVRWGEETAAGEDWNDLCLARNRLVKTQCTGPLVAQSPAKVTTSFGPEQLLKLRLPSWAAFIRRLEKRLQSAAPGRNAGCR